MNSSVDRVELVARLRARAGVYSERREISMATLLTNAADLIEALTSGDSVLGWRETLIAEFRKYATGNNKDEYGRGWNCGLEQAEDIVRRVAQPVDTNATCDLCVGECRGHSLGHPEEWIPEPGSRAAVDTNEAPLLDGLREAESEARRFASCYRHGSDGRNTLVMLADKIAAIREEAIRNPSVEGMPR